MKYTHKQMVAVAKLEIREWSKLPDGLAMVILWAFIHRLTTGNTVEESFFKSKPAESDYEI